MLKFPKDKVAITPIFDPDKTPGGLWIPDQAKERCDQGIVKYIGPSVEWVKIGMYVMFSGWSGELVKMEGEGSLIILQEKYVVAEIGEVENIHVPGLYYRSKVDKEAAVDELSVLIYEILLDHNVDKTQCTPIAVNMSNILVKHGVLGPMSSPYFDADYENIFNFISKAFQESDWYKGLKIKVGAKERLILDEDENATT